jgi:dipeptidyl aminopeptidase/acylaminoacyl peptidase
MKRILFSVALLAASAAYAQQPATPAAPAAAAAAAADPALLFGVRESVEQIDISPDGQKLVYLQPGPGRTTDVYVYNIAGGEPVRVTRTDGNPERLRWCRFATNDRLICRVTVMSTAAGVLANFSRLITMNTDGSDPKLLGQQESFYDARLRIFDGSVLDWSGGEAGTVLMVRDAVPEAGRLGTRLSRTANGLAVERVNLRTLRSNRVEAANPHAGGYLSDGRGNVRIMSLPQERSGSEGQMSFRVDYVYRTADSREWRPLGSFDYNSREGMRPLAVDPELNAAYVLKKLNGRMALYRVKLDGTLAAELVYANEQVDVDGVVTASRGEKVIGVTFADEQRRIVYFDPAYAAAARMLSRAIPNLPMIDFGTTSADGNLVIVHAGSDNDPGRYYIFNRTTRNLNEIMLVRPQLENVTLANVRSVTYPAPDGVQVPAYLTLPPGREARGLPVVVLPHGGPEARDEWGFDWLPQYLAHQGYAVLQPQYRGSAGYGDQWMQQNGFRGWRTSIGDITAGTRWLAAQGIGDPRRMAIVGWSYGGYAALQSGVTEPGLYRAIVAIAPVTDLQQAKDDAREYSDARNTAEFIGSGPHIREGSPLQNVGAITAPVLLFHGDRDLNVSIVHSRRMDSALRGAGKRSELVTFAGLEHDLADSTARANMLERIGAFLQTNLAPTP